MKFYPEGLAPCDLSPGPSCHKLWLNDPRPHILFVKLPDSVCSHLHFTALSQNTERTPGLGSQEAWVPALPLPDSLRDPEHILSLPF